MTKGLNTDTVVPQPSPGASDRATQRGRWVPPETPSPCLTSNVPEGCDSREGGRPGSELGAAMKFGNEFSLNASWTIPQEHPHSFSDFCCGGDPHALSRCSERWVRSLPAGRNHALAAGAWAGAAGRSCRLRVFLIQSDTGYDQVSSSPGWPETPHPHEGVREGFETSGILILTRALPALHPPQCEGRAGCPCVARSLATVSGTSQWSSTVWGPASSCSSGRNLHRI